MTGEITISDHTALFIVCDHMAAKAAVGNVDLIDLKDELERIVSHRSEFVKHRVKLCWNKYIRETYQNKFGRLPGLTFGQVYESDYRRSRRQRRAPDRLNIKTTSTHSYKN